MKLQAKKKLATGGPLSVVDNKEINDGKTPAISY